MKKFYIIIVLFFLTSCEVLNRTQEFQIKNEQNESLYVEVDGLENIVYHKLAIMQHGLASNMNHQAVRAVKKAFLANNYVVISFDDRYSLGKGNNEVEKVSLETFAQDLNTVTDWAKKQSFYQEPFALAGHSLGGASVLLFSAKNPQKVNILIPVTPVISGRLWEKSCMENLKDFCRNWQQKGFYEYTDPQNHKTAIISYKVITDSLNYNAFALAPKIKAETLLIAAENDIVINPEDVQKLSASLQFGNSAVIKSSGHNFEDKQNQNDLYRTVNDFLK